MRCRAVGNNNVVFYNTASVEKEYYLIYNNDTYSKVSESNSEVRYAKENGDIIIVNHISDTYTINVGGTDYAVTNIDNDNQILYFNDTYAYIKDKREIIDNYATNKEAVRCDLLQRLSIIKGEHWYEHAYGIPLLDKVKNKAIMDAAVIDIITSCPGVKNMMSYSSTLKNQEYSFEFRVLTSNDDVVEIKK